MEDNIYTYLKLDHKKVAKLFKLFESAKTERNQLEIIDLIKKELILHAESEQLTFYRVLENQKETKEEIAHAEREHKLIMTKLDKIFTQGRIDNALINKVMELKRMVEHHVGEEESKVFRDAKKVISDKEAYTLKFKMHGVKEQLLNKELTTEETLV